MYLAVRRERLAATGMSTLDFNVIDVETANADYSSICQIGTITVVNGVIKDRWATLVNPRDWFDSLNTSIHGISRNDVADSPTFPEAHQKLRHRLGNNSVLVSHMPFDRVAISRAEKKYGLEPLAVRWLNSAMIARHAWRDNFGKKGYGLKNIAQTLGIEFRHHDALEDARGGCGDCAAGMQRCWPRYRWLDKARQGAGFRTEETKIQARPTARTDSSDGNVRGASDRRDHCLHRNLV